MPELSEVEQWLVDLVRVGASGNASGVVQLGRRLIRKTPAGVTNAEALRAAVGESLLAASHPKFARGTALSAEAEPSGERTLLSIDAAPDPEEPVVAADVAGSLRRLIDERQRAGELAAAGLEPTSKVLLTGPPGVGKSMTARFLAARLGQPLLTLDLAAVMSSYLGRSGQNLSQALDEAQESGAVLFLDEFDAVAKYRDDKSDLGELKRLVNIVLLRLDDWDHRTLLVAATNHPELLDRAAARRFDLTVNLKLPQTRQREHMLSMRAAAHGGTSTWPDGGLETLAALSEGMSGSDLHRLSQAAARATVLEGEPSFEALFRAVLGDSYAAVDGRDSGRVREVACYAATQLLGWSNRQTAGALGISHPTVGKALIAYASRQQRDG